MTLLPRSLFFALCTLGAAMSASAQFEIRGGATNVLDGRRASGSAEIAGGAVTSITVRSGGGTYAVGTSPTVTIAPPGDGMTATATAEVSADGKVVTINVTNGGTNYLTRPAVFIAPPKTGAGVATTTPQFAAMANTSASAGADKVTLLFPRGIITANNTVVVRTTLVRASVGYSFASGVPRYFMGDRITPPTTNVNSVAVASSYWRSKPVEPGENFGDNVSLTNLEGATQPLLPLGNVVVTASTTTSSLVTVSTVPTGLVPGTVLLGQRVNMISGNTVTLAGNANATISTNTPMPYSPYRPYYYSPHADKVFATQPGRVTVTWVSAVPDTSGTNENVATYKFKRETFSVSSASQQPARVIYWTEKSFKAPLVLIPAGRIVRVNPVFNATVPGMTTEYVPVGNNPAPGAINTPEPRTFWFDDQNGPAALHAYNAEGRLFIEYLGAQTQGVNGTHEFLGADIVDIRRVAEVATIETKLGEKLRPRQEDPENGDDQLIPNVQFNIAIGGKVFYGSHIRPDGISDYFAERENFNPDLITFYWLQTNDAAIHFLPSPTTPGLAINWPKYKRNYTQVWPANLGDFEHVNVTQTGSNIAVGPQFAATNLPQLIFQDDPADAEAEVDPSSQRLIVNFTASMDKTNRSLLKFDSTSGPWYVRLFIQSQDLLGSPAIPDPDGAGPLVGTPAIYTVNDKDGDGVLDLAIPVSVGQRIEPPSPAYELGGYISKGRGYSEAAYKNPFATGVPAAASGGIIPVNALTNDKELTIWWFKKVTPPNAKFEPFYVPAIAARYPVSYPDSPQELVIASGNGVENPALTSTESAGSIYVQNDIAKIGYNPNEEHALMLAGNAYALREDLNLVTSSQPFILIQSSEPVSGRPTMRVLKVVRETDTYPLVYDKVAGTPAQAPMPLLALPLPLLPDGRSVRNTEVLLDVDTANASAPTSYNSFTFIDRKGMHWIYRGPHADGAPSFGMKYYYNLRPGFFFPSMANQPAVGSIHPFIRNVGNGEAYTVKYLPKWPDDPSLPAPKELGVLQTAETLTLQKENLSQVRGQSSAQVIYQQSIAQGGSAKPAVALHDPTRAKSLALGSLGLNLNAIPASVLTTEYAGKTWFQLLPPNLQNRFYFDANAGPKGSLILIGEFIHNVGSEDYLNLNQLSNQDIADLGGLCPDTDSTNSAAWKAAINKLATKLETFREDPLVPGSYVVDSSLTVPVAAQVRADVPDPDTAVDSYALSSTGKGTGYVTLVFNNGRAFTDPGNPVAVEIIKVSPDLYKGDLKVLLASNPLDEQVVLRHSGDYAGEPGNFEFEWRYGFPESGLPPTGDPATNPNWIAPNGTLGSSILVGGSPTAVLSAPAVLMGDTWFTMRYRLKAVGNTPAGAYSEWMTPALVEGWIKRVLAKITPFNQRMDDLYNTSLNTDVSLLTQAGTRWEGNIALNLQNINDAGLIEIYETILNRGKDFTIGSGIDFGPSNDALILAAGYLNDLYTIIGNEAFADAANPTISIDDQTTVTEVNTSRFSFEGQVASSLDEELALLRGRDDFGLPAVSQAPAYNRLFWNYTRGINSGEVLYAVNYNIKEKTGSPNADGVVNAVDAQRMFPQGHGDAYGHYLTALTGYYKLLKHPDFTWIPRAEAVTVLGQPVLIDYKDERKFAAAAANLTRSATQILALVHRQSYKDDPSVGWSSFRDGKLNSRTGVVRNQGFDETASRSAQGSFFNWVVGNALLPDVDTDPNHSGVQIVDRTTVPELAELVSAANSFQTTVDLANAHLNPLGLSPDAIAFDISPSEHKAGNSHYEQISARALRTLNNAKGSFDQAAKMTRLLRNQENQISSQQQAIEAQEYAYVNQLLDIYGSPYPGDIGPGKTYAQGYSGPDTERWSIIDRPSDLVDTSKPVTVTLRVPTQVKGFTGNAIDNILASYGGLDTTVKTFQVTPNRFSQFSAVIDPTGGMGRRPLVGSLQQALLESHLSQMKLLEANQALQALQLRFNREGQVFAGLVKSHADTLENNKSYRFNINLANSTATVLTKISEMMKASSETASDSANAAQESLPTSVGLATDVTAPARGGIRFAGIGIGTVLKYGGLAAKGAAMLLTTKANALEFELEAVVNGLGFDQSELQAAAEFENTYRELIAQHYRFAALAGELQQKNEVVMNRLADGQTILAGRESFRRRAASVITGYRTKDLTFRTFRNEALEQYRTLFDLASRYSYLAAKSYDYETGLLGTPAGQAVINRIVASRSLGDLTGGVPQATTSTLGDAGLAGTMAQLNADYDVAEGRLGINNSDPYGTLFSLRQELFRILDDPNDTEDDVAWGQTLEQHIVPDLMGDADVAKHCNNLRKPDGSPVPGIVISFGTSIQHGKNFFGLPLAGGDHAYSPSSFSTKINSAGMVFKGYVGMDPYVAGTTTGSTTSTDPNALAATPYIYLIPVGTDYMLAPPLGSTNLLRGWKVHDQALPLPYNLGASSFNATQFFTASGTLSEQPWILRKHQAFRPVNNAQFFYGSVPGEFTNSRLIGRSVWNGEWKIVIPAYTMLSNEQEALNRFVRSVKDIQLFLRTYSYSGN